MSNPDIIDIEALIQDLNRMDVDLSTWLFDGENFIKLKDERKDKNMGFDQE